MSRLSSFTRPQKLACWALARRLIALDGQFTDGEHARLQRITDEMGLDSGADQPPDQAELAELLAAFEDHDRRRELLRQLMILAHADQDYSPVEDDLLSRIMACFGMDQDVLAEIRQDASK